MSADSTRLLSVNTSDGESVGGLPAKTNRLWSSFYKHIKMSRSLPLGPFERSHMLVGSHAHEATQGLTDADLWFKKKPIQSSTLWPSQQRQPSCVCDNYSWACRTAWLTVCWDELIFYPPLGFPLRFSATSVTSIFMPSFTVSLQIDTASFRSLGCISLPLFVSLRQFFFKVLSTYLCPVSQTRLYSLKCMFELSELKAICTNIP